MKITEARKKLNKVKELTREFEMLDSSIRSMKLSAKSGLNISKPYLNSAKKRRDIVLSLFDNYLK